MEIKQIQTFVTIVEWGSFSEAANQLYLSQPTVSLHIKQLEQELGIELISRTTKSHELTVQGQEFYKYAKSFLGMAQNIETTFSHRNSHRVTIGASSIAATYILPAALAKYWKANSQKQIKLVQDDTINIINNIVLGSLNIGLVGSKSMNNNLIFEKVYTDRLVIVTPNNAEFQVLKEEGVQPEKLLNYPYISREEGSGTLKEAALLLRSNNIDPQKFNKIIEINNNETIKQFIHLGLGITVMSELAIQEELSQNKVLAFPFDDEHSARDFYLVYRKNSHLPDASRELIAFLKNHFNH